MMNDYIVINGDEVIGSTTSEAEARLQVEKCAARHGNADTYTIALRIATNSARRVWTE